MKKNILIIIALLLCMPAFAQRLKVKTYGNTAKYKKHYTHPVEVDNINDTLYAYIIGNLTDEGTESKEISGHLIFNMDLLDSKKAKVTPSPDEDNIHLTDFGLFPDSEGNIRYVAATGAYFPDGFDVYGYPFLGIYDRNTGNIVSFDYYDLLYGSNDTMQSAGLRIKYSSDEQAYYICGLMANKRFGDIDIYNINSKTKGFILKIDANGQDPPKSLVFKPDSVNNNAWLSIVSDIEINEDEDKIAFTGVNTKDTLSGFHHPMTGIADMDLNLQWCYAYEITSYKFTGVDVVFNDDDTSLFVLLNSKKQNFSVMELDDNGAVLQDPWEYRFKGNSITNDTTRAHTMHYFNDTLIVTGNHFGTESSTDYQYLFRFDLNADTIMKNYNNPLYYSKQEVPAGYQVPVYSYWTPENSDYKEYNLHLVGVYNEYDKFFGFKYVSVNGIAPVCIDTLGFYLYEPQLDDTVSCDAETEECDYTEENAGYENFPSVKDTLECNCTSKQASILETNEIYMNDDIWQLKRIYEKGIEAVLIAEKPTVYNVSVHDILGREVYRSDFNVNEGQTFIKIKFDVKPVVYIVRISSGTKTNIRKIVKP